MSRGVATSFWMRSTPSSVWITFAPRPTSQREVRADGRSNSASPGRFDQRANTGSGVAGRDQRGAGGVVLTSNT
jgi:hypothetical protein